MAVTTISARNFARDLAAAKRATSSGPVFVTDRGKPTFALLRIEEYYRLAEEQPRSLLDVMDSLPAADVDFQPPRLTKLRVRPANLK
jgi:PHD/YefM family antitoxin component YafN of YafNO toxin-antitoxin module